MDKPSLFVAADSGSTDNAIAVWMLARGQKFRFPGDSRIWIFHHMDGMYAHAIETASGRMAVFVADVIPLDD